MLFLTDWFPASLCRNVLPPALPLTTCPGYTHGEYNCSVFPKCHIKPARLKGFVELSENILLSSTKLKSTALHFNWDYSVFVSATKHTQKGLINLLNKCQRSYFHKLQQKKNQTLGFRHTGPGIRDPEFTRVTSSVNLTFLYHRLRVSPQGTDHPPRLLSDVFHSL